MLLKDDTPEHGATPDIYPIAPPVNLLRSEHELSPTNFFAFEGIDGAGKSTLACLAAERLTTSARTASVLALKSSGVVAHALERAKWLNADPLTINLLNWIVLVEGTLQARDRLSNPAHLILADRYTLTISVRGVLEGLDPSYMTILEGYIPRPRRIFLIDTDPAVCAERIRASQRNVSYFEAGHRVVPAIGEPMIESSPSERDSTEDRTAGLLTHLERARREYLDLATSRDNVTVIANAESSDHALDEICDQIIALGR